MKADERSLKHFLEQREVNGDYPNWMMKLMGFDFAIEYNPGRSNLVADALSRVPQGVMELGALLSSNGIDWDFSRRGQQGCYFSASSQGCFEKGAGFHRLHY